MLHLESSWLPSISKNKQKRRWGGHGTARSIARRCTTGDSCCRRRSPLPREQKKPQSQSKHSYGTNRSVRAENEKILTASDGRYKRTAVKSRGQSAKQVSRCGTAARRKYNVTWGRRRSPSLQLLRCLLHKQEKHQTWCSGTALELRGPIRAGWVEEQPQTQGPCSFFSPTSSRERAVKKMQAQLHLRFNPIKSVCRAGTSLFSNRTRECIACGYAEQGKRRTNIHPLTLLI